MQQISAVIVSPGQADGVVITARASVEGDGVLVLALVLQLPSEVVGGRAVSGLLHDLRGLVEVTLRYTAKHTDDIL
jgi:hypothetical protein